MKKSIGILPVLIILLWMPAIHTHAQSLIPGMDAVVTKSSYIGPITTVALVKRVGDPLASAAPFNTNWVPPAITPAITQWTDTVMGQIFGTTIDLTGNVYFAATAGYYYNPTSYTNMSNLAKPALLAVPAGIGGFHTDIATNSIGLIYMASATNLNNVTAIVTAENNGVSTIPGISSGIGTKKIPNTGYGIGNIAFSKTYSHLYATNLEDGKIYAIIQSSGATNGKIDAIFDPFAADNGTAGLAPYGERLFAVGVNDEFDGTTRLYYSVLKSVTATESKSEIWSVKLTAGGQFDATDNHLEIIVPDNTYLLGGDYFGTFVSDIAFSVRGELLVAEKGYPHAAHDYQYYGRHNAWSAPQDLYVSSYSGYSPPYHSSNGGVDYGFMKNSAGATVCDSLIWTTENAWASSSGSATWYGMQSMPHDGYLGAVATYPNQAYIVDLDGVPGLPDMPKGRFGDIVFYDGACPGGGPTDICSKVSITIEPTVAGACCYNVYVRNSYNASYFTGLDIETNHLNIDNVTSGNTWGGITYQAPNGVNFGDTSKLWYMPKDTTFLLAKICLSGSGADVLKIHLIGNAPQFDSLCYKEVPVTGCGVPVDTNCVGVLHQEATCVDGVAYMQFQIKNNSNFTMRAVTFYNLNPNVKAVNDFFPIADLLPGSTSPVYTVPLVIQNNDSAGCFYFSACDLHVYPGTSGQYPTNCCMDSIPYCIKVPHCDGCDAIDVTAVKQDSVNCCYKLNLTNHYSGTAIKCVQFQGIGGTQFSILSGWNVMAPVSSNNITICAPGGSIGDGTYPGFVSFCLTGTSASPHSISVSFLDASGKVLCTKLLTFQDCELVKPTCANIINDSLYCDGTNTKFSFSIKNNSPFVLYQVDLRLSDTGFKLNTNEIVPSPPIAIGGVGGPYTITIDSNAKEALDFCIYLTGHNNVYIPDSSSATECCTDSLGVICLPVIHCDSMSCCQFEGLVIPNGITPNGDGINDVWVIQNSKICSSIAMTVYNRWGNIVYKDANYKNNWGGTNQSGKLLPQGTYFIVLKLASGLEKSMYIDVRY
jgi:gliding motility-associated-like protein